MSDCGCPRERSGEGMERRTFLGWLAAGLGGAIASALRSTGVSYFVSPAFKKDEEDWVDVAAVKVIRPGSPV